MRRSIEDAMLKMLAIHDRDKIQVCVCVCLTVRLRLSMSVRERSHVNFCDKYWTSMTYVHPHKHTHSHTYAHTHTHTLTHTNMNVCAYVYMQIPDPATVERRALLVNQIFELWHVGERTEGESADEKPPIGADMAALNGCLHEVCVSQKKKKWEQNASFWCLTWAALRGCLNDVRV